MPELPDVEVFRRTLVRRGLVGSRIDEVDVLRPSIVKAPDAVAFADELQGRTIDALTRRAKFLLANVGEGWLVLHMGMTGMPHIENLPVGRSPYSRVVFRLDGDRELRFVDPRVFGSTWFLADTGDLLRDLGPEPLNEDLSANQEFSTAFLADRFRGRRAPVKSLLLQQRTGAGVGNIYADEALFDAKLHPSRPGGSLRTGEIESLRRAIVTCLADAIVKLDELAASGRFVGPPTETLEGASEVLKVSRKAGASCTSCSASVERTVVGGRGTYWCPSCQGAGS